MASSELERRVRDYWDIDSHTYDRSSGHSPRTRLELAAWAASLRRLLPPPPAHVLDVGAGTGFLSLLLAREGYRVTALDLAPGMLERLGAKARDLGFEIELVEGNAADPPRDDFDGVVERHVVWTLPEPAAALEAWRAAAPRGTLVLLESVWGSAAGPEEQLRGATRELLRRVKGVPSDHHREYDQTLREAMPLGFGASPDALVALVEASSWGYARVERLRDVDWAARQASPSLLERVVGVAPHFAVVAGSGH